MKHSLLIKAGNTDVGSIEKAVCVAHIGTGNDGIDASYRVRYAVHGPILGIPVDAPGLSPRPDLHLIQPECRKQLEFKP